MHIAYADSCLFIDGTRYCSYDSGCRDIFLLGEDLVMKMEDNFKGNQSLGEAKLLSKIMGRDRIYFPKLYASGILVDESTEFPDPKGIAWVLMERITFDYRNHTRKDLRIVKRLVKKYGIDDIHWGMPSLDDEMEAEERCNWTISATTDKPMIYDIGLNSLNRRDWMKNGR